MTGTQDPLLSLDEALARMLTGVEPLPAESVPLEDAIGRFCASDVQALVTVPPWDNSAMDGFAVRSEDVAAASAETPVTLSVTGEVAAGHAPQTSVRAGTALRILTGAMLPDGADAVVPVEDTDANAGVAALPDEVEIRAAAAPGAHVRRAGSDTRQGDAVLAAGKRVGPAALALLAATGHASIAMHGRPVVTVLPTGDELVAAGVELLPGKIHDSNGPMLRAQARSAGAEVLAADPVQDRFDDVLERLEAASRRADVVIVSGGVSVGAHDVVKEAFASIGRIDLWRVAVQPGKPLAFGVAPGRGREGRDLILVGLPGNPVSSFVTFELFVRPVLGALAGDRTPTTRRTVRGRLAEPVTKAFDRRAFLRVAFRGTSAGGLPEVRLAGGQGSHMLSALAAADGLAVVPEDVVGLPAGAEVDVWELDR